MNPFIKTPWRLMSSLAIWAALGGLLGVFLWIFYQVNLFDALPLHVISGLLLGVASSSAYFVSLNTRPTQRQFLVSLLLISGGALFIGFALVIAYKALDSGLVYAGLQIAPVSSKPLLLVPVFILGTLAYAFSLITYDALISAEAIKGVEQREAARELWAKHAELKALRAQINPHFLFNSLNSISALTSFNAEKARAMIIELSQFYRESLTVSDLPLISIEREIAICKHFIAIEMIRYGEKLKLDIDCNAEAFDYQVPPLCLQPLLENAIKHGISQLTAASPISLKVDVQHNKLYVLVGNDIASEQGRQKPEGTQTGLENLRSRLALLYGEQAYCGWTKTETRFQVELIFPLSKREEQ